MAATQKPYLTMLTIDHVPGRTIQPLGLVIVHMTEGMGVFRDLFAKVSDFLGGRAGKYDSSVKDLIFRALRGLSDQAWEVYGSNGENVDAIVGLTVDVQPIASKGMAMMQITAYGTVAVLVEEHKNNAKSDELDRAHGPARLAVGSLSGGL